MKQTQQRDGPAGLLLSIHPGHLSEGTRPMLLSYHEGREGQQQGSVPSETQSDLHDYGTDDMCWTHTSTSPFR